MSDWDRPLVELITDLDTGGYGVNELRELVEIYGAARVVRVITDGIAGVVPAEAGKVLAFDSERRFLPLEEVVGLVGREPVPIQYRVVDLHAGVARDGSLLFAYAADEAAPLAEVRARLGRR